MHSNRPYDVRSAEGGRGQNETWKANRVLCWRYGGAERAHGMTYQSPALSVREGVLGVLLPAAADANVLGGAILKIQAAVSCRNESLE